MRILFITLLIAVTTIASGFAQELYAGSCVCASKLDAGEFPKLGAVILIETKGWDMISAQCSSLNSKSGYPIYFGCHLQDEHKAGNIRYYVLMNDIKVPLDYSTFNNNPIELLTLPLKSRAEFSVIQQ